LVSQRISRRPPHGWCVPRSLRPPL
jgi:hypothetical protein